MARAIRIASTSNGQTINLNIGHRVLGSIFSLPGRNQFMQDCSENDLVRDAFWSYFLESPEEKKPHSRKPKN